MTLLKIDSVYYRANANMPASLSLLRGQLIRRLVNYQSRRYLDLQEFQSKQILHEHGVKVQKFKVVEDPEQVKQVIHPKEFGPLKLKRWSGMEDDISSTEEFVIKAQVLAGGRGKGHFLGSGMQGGVQLIKDRQEAIRVAENMINDTLVTKQTTAEGVKVERVMIAEAVRLRREFYFAIVLDRSYDSGPILIGSPEGGMDIEEIAAMNSKAIRKFTLPIDLELDYETARSICMMAFNLNLIDGDILEQCADQVMKLHSLFLKLDANQIEINPLGVTNKNQVICVDAKIKFDENARFRQRWLDELEEMNRDEVDQRDHEARRHNLNFIGLDGNIGCLVNGAGLAMATMDIIKLHGGSPANFLDVGGGATASQVTEAFRIISSDSKVRAILVNIFGGIMRCDVIAEGIIQATKTLNLKIPVICRLQGSKMEEAQKLIAASDLRVMIRDDFDEAARLAVEASA